MTTLIYLFLACGAPGAAFDSDPTLDTGDTAAPAWEAVRPSEAVIYCMDVDGDGWGDGDYLEAICGPEPREGWARIGDCDDYQPQTYPGAPEIYDGIDNNCDGRIDEGVQPV